jgi:hypothetical protein
MFKNIKFPLFTFIISGFYITENKQNNNLEKIFNENHLFQKSLVNSLRFFSQELKIIIKNQKDTINTKNLSVIFFDYLTYLQLINFVDKDKKLGASIVRSVFKDDHYQIHLNKIKSQFKSFKSNAFHKINETISDINNEFENGSSVNFLIIFKILSDLEKNLTFLFLAEYPLKENDEIFNWFFMDNFFKQNNNFQQIQTKYKENFTYKPTQIFTNYLNIDLLIHFFKPYQEKKNKETRDFSDFSNYVDCNRKIQNIYLISLMNINNLFEKNLKQWTETFKSIDQIKDFKLKLQEYYNINGYYEIIYFFMTMAFNKVQVLIQNNKNYPFLDNIDFIYFPHYIINSWKNSPHILKDNFHRDFFGRIEYLSKCFNEYILELLTIQDKLIKILKNENNKNKKEEINEILNLYCFIFEIHLISLCNDSKVVNDYFKMNESQNEDCLLRTKNLLKLVDTHKFCFQNIPVESINNKFPLMIENHKKIQELAQI